MQVLFPQVALIGKYHAHGARPALEEVAQFLSAQGSDVVLETDTASSTGIEDYPVMHVGQIGELCDLAVIVGGDGTMLGMGRQLARSGVPLIGINQGRLGFITDIPLDAFRAALTPMLRGDFEVDHRNLIQGRVMRGSECVFDALAMNDVVVNRGTAAGMVELRVEVDGHFVANQRADGLIVASSTGSTAYSLSAGGPLMHPAVAGWVIVPIAPHTLSNRPLVVTESSEIAIEIVAGRDASANFDMQSLASLMIGDRIIVRRSQYQARFLHPRGWSYFDTLRKKLHWNESSGA